MEEDSRWTEGRWSSGYRPCSYMHGLTGSVKAVGDSWLCFAILVCWWKMGAVACHAHGTCLSKKARDCTWSV
eukprot:2820340-Alexandrium_andersonii.AAC.2